MQPPHSTNSNNTINLTSQVFKALGEPPRLRILALLMQRESLCVCDLVAVLSLGQSLVSRHLSYLKNAGLVDDFREGTWKHYRINPETLRLINIETLLSVLHNDSIFQTDLDNLRRYESQPRSCGR